MSRLLRPGSCFRSAAHSMPRSAHTGGTMEQRAVSDRPAVTGIPAIISAITILSSVACGNADKGSTGEADTEGLRAVVGAAGLARAAHAPHCAPRAATLRYRVTDMGSLASPDDPFA